MLLLLNPRVWIALALVAILVFSHTFMYRKGKANVQTQWDLSVATANAEARRLEQKRQDRVDEAAVLATKRASVISADSSRAADSVHRLRDAIAARRSAEESAATAVKRADTAEQLLLESAGAYRELAEKADRHASDVRLLLDAWPK